MPPDEDDPGPPDQPAPSSLVHTGTPYYPPPLGSPAAPVYRAVIEREYYGEKARHEAEAPTADEARELLKALEIQHMEDPELVPRGVGPARAAPSAADCLMDSAAAHMECLRKQSAEHETKVNELREALKRLLWEAGLKETCFGCGAAQPTGVDVLHHPGCSIPELQQLVRQVSS